MESDNSISPKPKFSAPWTAMPAANQIDIEAKPLAEAHLWCSRSNDALRDVSLTFKNSDLAVSSKSVSAEAISADTACTMTDSKMQDCDALIKQAYAAVEKGGVFRTVMTDDGWMLWATNHDQKLAFDFLRMGDTVVDSQPLHLNRQ